MSVSDPVLWVELLMLSALLTAGLCVAYTDLRFQRVPNRYTLTLLGIGVTGQVAMVGLGVGGWNQVAGTLLLGLGVALLMMVAGVWSPGDAKMYWAAVAALPPSLCPVGQWVSLETPPAALIVNAVVAYVAVLLAVVVWRQRQWKTVQGNRGPWLQAAAGLGGSTRHQPCAGVPRASASDSNAASARSFRPRAPTTLRTVSKVGLRSPESAL